MMRDRAICMIGANHGFAPASGGFAPSVEFGEKRAVKVVPDRANSLAHASLESDFVQAAVIMELVAVPDSHLEGV